MVVRKVHSELARFLLRHGQQPISAGILFAFGWLLLLGPSIPTDVALSWLTAQVVLGVFRFFWARKQIQERTWETNAHLIILARNLLISSGVLWAIGILLFFPYLDDRGQMVLLFLVMGLFPFPLLALQNVYRTFEFFSGPIVLATLISVIDGSPQEWLMFCVMVIIHILLSVSMRKAYLFRLDNLTNRFTKEEQAEELLRDNKTIQTRSERDGMTGLYNRTYFDTQLEVLWRFGGRAKTPLCLLIIDVDYFKSYNDNYGHQAGDRTLRQFGDILQKVLHREDDVAARYGGEEFAILLPNTAAQGGLDVAERIRESLAREGIRHEYSKVSSSVTCTIGISCLVPSPKDDPAIIIGKADEALYRGKNMGRNQVALAPRGG